MTAMIMRAFSLRIGASLSKKILAVAILSIVFIITPQCVADESTSQPEQTVRVVDSVSLERYVGLWYEIAKIPNRFQKKCAGGATAFYDLREDGKVDIINRCYDKNEHLVEAKGIAKIVDTRSNAKLKVSFVRFLGTNLFWGDYWIIGLGADYEYAIVGTPNRKYGWILGRSKVLADTTISEIFSLLRQQGYNPDAFQMTAQSEESKLDD